MDLPWKPHFGIVCSCGAACVSELTTPEQVKIAQQDSVLALRSLSAEDQKASADFYAKHKEMGHDPEPQLMSLSALPKA